MTFQFHFTDAGRSMYMPKERNDCTVRAVALLFDVDYPTAHRALKTAGRRDGCRFPLATKHSNIKINGKHLKQVKCLRAPLSQWLAEDTAHYGRDYILGIAGHVFCVKNGVIYDSEQSAKSVRPLKIAKYFYTIIDA